MFKTVLHSVSYAGFWPGQTRLSLDDFLVRAKTLGFDGVMLMAKRPHLSLLDFDPAAIERLADRVQELELSVACLASYTDFTIGNDHPEIPCREYQIAAIAQLVKIAARLSCPFIRVFTTYDRPGVSYDQAWTTCVDSLRECAQRAADYGVTIAVQNHHDVAAGAESLADLLEEIDHPHCKAAFDAWAPALHGTDLVAATRRLAPWIVHTTVADYVRRERFRYVPNLVNYVAEPDVIRAVPMGEGFIDYRAFFATLREIGYAGAVAYEMCSTLRGGGSETNLDHCARQFVSWMREVHKHPVVIQDEDDSIG